MKIVQYLHRVNENEIHSPVCDFLGNENGKGGGERGEMVLMLLGIIRFREENAINLRSVPR